MRLLLTGASGFLGQHLLPLLDEHDVMILSRRSVRLPASTLQCRQLVGDLACAGSWQAEVTRFAPDCCIHLAWQGLPDYSLESCHENLDAGLRLLATLKSAQVKRIVVAGSCWEYGRMSGAVAEDAHPIDCGVFAATKHSLRMIMESVAREAGIEYRWARVFFVYGPGQRSSSLIPHLTAEYAAGRQPTLREPQTVQDFVHVGDVARGLKSLAEGEGPSGIYNIGTGQPTSISSVANLVAKHFDKRPSFAEPSTGSGCWADPDRIHSAFGWKASINIDAGVSMTLAAATERS